MRRSSVTRLTLALLLACAALTGCRHAKTDSGEAPKEGSDAGAEPVAVEMATATTHPMETTVVAQGTVSPGQGAMARVAPSVAGRLITVTVREGDRVQAGQVIALVDNRPQKATVAGAQAAFTNSAALAQEAALAAQAAATDQANAVRLAHLSLDSARLDRENAIKTAQNAFQQAAIDLKKTQAGARPQEIAQADQAVNQAKATRDRAAIELDRQKKLLAIGETPQRDVEDAQTAYQVAEAALQSAQQQASLVRAGARPEDLQAAQLRVDGAKEALRQAQTSGDAKVAQAQAALRQAEQSALQVKVKEQDARAQQDLAQQKRADLAAAQATASYAEVRAPISGIVTRRALNPGDMADTTNPIVEISDTRQLNLQANLSAEEGLQVRVGMSAQIVASDAPDRPFTGRVLSVGAIDPQTNLLAVRIAVSNPTGLLKVGVFATANILLHTNPRAVVVPKEAVILHDNKTVVFVVGADGVAHQKDVTVGPEQDGLIAISHGLAPGDKVIRLGQYELTDGAKVKEAEKEEKASDKEDAKPKDDKS